MDYTITNIENINYLGNVVIQAPFQVRTFGHIQHQPMHSTPGTKDGDMMLIMNVKGIGYHLAKVKTVVKPGMMGLIKTENSGILYSDKADPYDHYFIRFRGDYALHLADQILQRHGKVWFEDKNVISVPRMMPSHAMVIRRTLPDEMGHIELALASILLMFLKQEELTQRSKVDRLEVSNYMDMHLEEPFDLEKMAERFNMAKPSLSRWAKRIYGRTLLEEYEAIRMERARQFLQSTRLKILEIAERVGYPDPLYFSKVFKKHHQLSPRQFREQHL